MFRKCFIIDFSIITAYVHEEINKVEKQLWRNFPDPSQISKIWWLSDL